MTDNLTNFIGCTYLQSIKQWSNGKFILLKRLMITPIASIERRTDMMICSIWVLVFLVTHNWSKIIKCQRL